MINIGKKSDKQAVPKLLNHHGAQCSAKVTPRTNSSLLLNNYYWTIKVITCSISKHNKMWRYYVLRLLMVKGHVCLIGSITIDLATGGLASIL